MAVRSRRKSAMRKNNRLGSTVIFGVLLLAVLVLSVQTAHLKSREASYARQEQQLSLELRQEQKKSETLAQREIQVQTRQYIESLARQKFGLVHPDEVLVTPRP